MMTPRVSVSCFASAVMRLLCVAQWRRVVACITDGHCSTPLDVNDFRSVALCHNGRMISEPSYGFGSVIDAVSGAKLSDRRYDCLRVDTSGALLWRDGDKTFVVSSGPNSAGHVLADVDGDFFKSFRYGVAIDSSEHCVLRFDVDIEPTAKSECKASVAVRATLRNC